MSHVEAAPWSVLHAALIACALASCGDDDDFIFMEPDLEARLATGSSTTIYATTAGPDGPNLNLMEAAKVAYGSTVGSQAWDCGRIAP